MTAVRDLQIEYKEIEYKTIHSKYAFMILKDTKNKKKLWCVFDLEKLKIKDTTQNMCYNVARVIAIYESKHMPDNDYFCGFEFPSININQKEYNLWLRKYGHLYHS